MGLALRATCQKKTEADPRPNLRRANRRYVFALLHQNQLAGVIVNDEPAATTLVSKSSDGALAVPLLKITGVMPLRGSKKSPGGQDKGGQDALQAAVGKMRQGIPALLTVDGPRGPRGSVHRGIISLAQSTQAVILPVMAEASRNWILHKTWDGMRIPKPFSVCTLRFAEPIEAPQSGNPDRLRQKIKASLDLLESTRWP